MLNVEEIDLLTVGSICKHDKNKGVSKQRLNQTRNCRQAFVAILHDSWRHSIHFHFMSVYRPWVQLKLIHSVIQSGNAMVTICVLKIL